MPTTDPYTRNAVDYLEPPRGFWATARHLGPGMILVGSVVGSGELIVTTKLGAVAGFVLLWFVLLSCFVKVVVQTELARHTIASGQTFLRVFNSLPGPKAPRPAWLTLPWMAVVILCCVGAVATFVHLDESSRTAPAALLLSAGVVIVSLLTAWMVSRRESASGGAVPGTVSQLGTRPDVNWFTWLWLASLVARFRQLGSDFGRSRASARNGTPGYSRPKAEHAIGRSSSRFSAARCCSRERTVLWRNCSSRWSPHLPC